MFQKENETYRQLWLPYSQYLLWKEWTDKQEERAMIRMWNFIGSLHKEIPEFKDIKVIENEDGSFGVPFKPKENGTD